MRIGVVAGEPSGDLLGAGLIRALRRSCPNLQVEGIGGEQMQAAGCRILHSASQLAVMGTTELLGRLYRILRIRAQLYRHFRDQPPTLFVGIDAPEFNLGLEERLHRAGIPTVHYVSPSVWAWRRYRLRRIARAVDLMLVLFPFEERLYRHCGIPVRLVGHALADRISSQVDARTARSRLGLHIQGPLIALLPGSRQSELERLSKPFLQTAEWCWRRRPELRFVANVLSPADGNRLRRAAAELCPGLPLQVLQGRSLDVMEAADAVLLASGTAALEAMCLQRPMVVAYRMSWLSAGIARALVRTPYFSLPNIIAGRALVPEFWQGAVRAERMGPALLAWLQDSAAVSELQAIFRKLRGEMGRGADQQAAAAVRALLSERAAGAVRQRA